MFHYEGYPRLFFSEHKMLLKEMPTYFNLVGTEYIYSVLYPILQYEMLAMWIVTDIVDDNVSATRF